jgi:hypothetical protein
MAVGPVDVYIIGFPGNKFTGRIAPAILELVENGTIRVLDLLFVMKDADGVVTTLEASDLDEEGAGFVFHAGDDGLVAHDALLKELQARIFETRIVGNEVAPCAPRARQNPMTLRQVLLGDFIVEKRLQVRR